MLRYVLNEVISGTSGNENWPADFRADVSVSIWQCLGLADNRSYSRFYYDFSNEVRSLIGAA
jgi:hypothetical protein